jgi:putative transposase
MSDCIIRTIEFKLYPNQDQIRVLEAWLRNCCWLYNRMLDQRIKAYKRRKESSSLYSQQVMLTSLRCKIESVRMVPAQFARDALRRVDRGMKSFFRRCKAGEKKVGFPRFRSWKRYNSMEQLQTGQFIRSKVIFVPGIGEVRARGQFDADYSKQVGIRIIKRASGWYAQVLVKSTKPDPLPTTGNECGIDLGLESFIAMDSGETIGNPRHLRKSAKKLRREQQQLSRCQRGSKRRIKAARRVSKIHELVKNQRRGFCHRVSRDIVNRFDRIAIENLSIAGLARSKLAKSVLDACWGFFVFCLTYKAEYAGRELVKVDPRGTSKECPSCGEVVAKKLSERTHRCGCGFIANRDVAAAMIVRNRAFRRGRGESVRPVATPAVSMKRRGNTNSVATRK